MFSFIKNSVPNNVAGSNATPEPVSVAGARPAPDMRHELIQMVFKNTLHHLGVPLDWLACEVLVNSAAEGSEQLHIQLTWMKWQEIFLRYGPAFERQLIKGLDRFDPERDHSQCVISWRFSPDCGCPFTVMPPPSFWAHTSAPAEVAEVAEVAKVLPSLLDRRQRARPGNSQAPSSDEDYERTQLAPFASSPPAPPDDEGYERTQLSPFL